MLLIAEDDGISCQYVNELLSEKKIRLINSINGLEAIIIEKKQT
jgi:hypothetical protein